MNLGRVYVYIMVCMCTTVYHVVVNVGVDLWGLADEYTVMDETLGRAPVLLRSALWRVGLAGTSTERVDPR